MPSDDTRKQIAGAIAQLRLAQQTLEDTIGTTGDEKALSALTAQCRALKELIDSLTRAQLITDDAVFARATKDLTAQASALKAQEEHLRSIIKDVGTTAKVVDYITQAIAFIGKL